jgi:predicted DNA-binding ribbon-helix-helix protein
MRHIYQEILYEKKLLNLTDRQFEILNKIAKEKEISLSELIRRIFDEIIQKEFPEKISEEKK